MGKPDFVGGGGSGDEECPAVHRDPLTGGFFLIGRRVTDPAVIDGLREHLAIAADEAVIWQPADMADPLAEAAAGTYEQGRQGPGEPTFRDLLARTRCSAVHLEMRDTYEPDHPGFNDWLKGGAGRVDRTPWTSLVEEAATRGVRIRRARIVSEPPTDYIRWEHMITDVNIAAGEDVRWLPRQQASDLMLPHADFWMFDNRIVRFNYQAGDGTSLKKYQFVSDPRHVAPVVAAFEMVWERAIPHQEYDLDHTPPAG